VKAKMMLAFHLRAVILESILSFEERWNGLYNLLLSVAAVCSVWKEGIIGSPEST
jgi:hypothetical protein